MIVHLIKFAEISVWMVTLGLKTSRCQLRTYFVHFLNYKKESSKDMADVLSACFDLWSNIILDYKIHNSYWLEKTHYAGFV